MVDRGPDYSEQIEDARLVERFEVNRGEHYAEEAREGGFDRWLGAFAVLVLFWVLDFAGGFGKQTRGFFDFWVLAASLLVVNRCALRLVPRRGPAVELEPDTPSSAMAVCSACGASVLFARDTPEARCSYCGAVLVEPSVVARGRAERAEHRAREAARQAEELEHGGREPPDLGGETRLLVVTAVAAVLAVAAYALLGSSHLLSNQELSLGLLLAASVGVGLAVLMPRPAS